MNNAKLIVIADNPDNVIHGVCDFLAVAGNGVVRDPNNVEALIPATGTRAYLLTRDVVATRSIEDMVVPQGVVYPTVKGEPGTARKVTQAEIEGTDLLITSGTGALSNGTAVNTELGWYSGRLRAKQSGEEIAGWVRGQLTPLEGGTVRLMVELN